MTETVEQKFERLAPKLEAAVNYAFRTHSIEDLKQLVEEGKMHFWPMENSAVMTEMTDLPQARILNIFGGGNAEEIMKVLDDTRVWGKTLGCSRVSFLGRQGWRKWLVPRGWTDHRMSCFSIPTE
jgi:hypothetical protein